MATLVEQYLQETRAAGIARPAPSVHRVIPVEEAIPFDLEIFPYERTQLHLQLLYLLLWDTARCG